jgi:hypothetical protein
MFLFRPLMEVLLTPAFTLMNLLGTLIAPYQVGPAGVV